jgi:2-amino-4-hydroxy-6-hydroxymethyldihydropteridine diphosphokinase
MANLKKIHLLTGANLGHITETLAKAKALLEEQVGEVAKASALYETEPWGNVDQPNYVNQALEITTALSPYELLKTTKSIEEQLGRERKMKWGARVIDIDILFYANHEITSDTLTIPHPYIHRRNFVLIPMLEIAPDKQHPVFKKTIEELYMESEDELEVYHRDMALINEE